MAFPTAQHHKPRILSLRRTWRGTLVLCSLVAAFLPTCVAVTVTTAQPDILLAPGIPDILTETASMFIPRVATTTTIAHAEETLVLDSYSLDRGASVSYGDDDDDKDQELRRRKHDTVTSSARTTMTMATGTSASASASPLPSILDSSLDSAFLKGSTCLSFINGVLADPTFQLCYPLSLLLQESSSFFEAERSFVTITQVLDATCAANVTFCSQYLADIAGNLTEPAACSDEMKSGNPVAVQTYEGMVAYAPLYQAGCLKDQDSHSYCYANAITNLTSPSDAYVYFLPLNNTLPSNSAPTCNWCLKNTMAIFRSTAANRKQSIARTYLSAAQQVDAKCGPAFVDDTLPSALASAGLSLLRHSTLSPGLLTVALLTAALHVLL